MVSVIVNVYDSHKYLIRCLNSIKRQTYKNIEILVVSEDKPKKLPENIDVKWVDDKCKNRYELLKNAVDKATGKYVCFCSSDSMMTDNSIEKLVSVREEYSTCPYAEIYTQSGEDYKANDMAHASICGRLFDKQKLIEVLLEGVQQGKAIELDIFAGYLSKCDSVMLAEGAEVYEAREANILWDISKQKKDIMYWEKLLDYVADVSSTDKMRNYITAAIGKVIVATQSDTKEIILYAAETLHNDIALNYAIAAKTVKLWWNKLLDLKNKEEYKLFVDYISLFENELVAEMLLKDCGIEKKTFEAMKSNEQTVFLGIIQSVQNDILTTKKLVEVNGTNELTSTHKQEQTEEYTYELSGVQLAEFVIDKYKNGNLGLKTIIKSLIAWIKYKI